MENNQNNDRMYKDLDTLSLDDVKKEKELLSELHKLHPVKYVLLPIEILRLELLLNNELDMNKFEGIISNIDFTDINTKIDIEDIRKKYFDKGKN